MATKAKTKTEAKVEVAPVDEAPKPAPALQRKKPATPKDVIRVVAVVRPMNAPHDGVLIPEGGPKGVLIKKGSWATAQLERGLLRIVE